MKQIKILYISEFFFPINQVASIRATKFCKYLSQNPDISVSVVCRSYEDMATDFLLEKDVSKISQIFRVSVNQYGVRLVSKLRLRVRAFFHLRDSQRIQKVGLESSKKQSYSIKNEIGRLFRVFSDELACSAYIRNAKRVLRKSSVPDIIISSYGPKSSPILGGWYKKRHPEVYWISDFRDPVYRGFSTPHLLVKRSISYVQRVCKEADVLTSVSQGCMDALHFPSHPHKAVIYNGFDRDDISLIENTISPLKFTLSYMGTIYKDRQDLSPIFMILRELIDEGILDVEKVCIRYAGPSKMAFASLSRRFGLDRCVEAFDTVPRATSLKYQLESHLLLLASWNLKGEEGIITGKLLEYMMIGRPIIGLVSGELKDSAVKEMLRLGNLGVCYEQANKEQDFSFVKQYVVEQYNQFIDGAQPKHKPNHDYVEQYNYQNLTKQLVSHFPKKIHQRICKYGSVGIQE